MSRGLECWTPGLTVNPRAGLRWHLGQRTPPPVRPPRSPHGRPLPLPHRSACIPGGHLPGPGPLRAPRSADAEAGTVEATPRPREARGRRELGGPAGGQSNDHLSSGSTAWTGSCRSSATSSTRSSTTSRTASSEAESPCRGGRGPGQRRRGTGERGGDPRRRCRDPGQRRPPPRRRPAGRADPPPGSGAERRGGPRRTCAAPSTASAIASTSADRPLRTVGCSKVPRAPMIH